MPKRSLSKTAQGYLSYAALLVLEDLRKASPSRAFRKSHSGKCVCHLAANVGVEEDRNLYRLLAELISDRLVEIRLPSEPRDDLAALYSRTMEQERYAKSSVERFGIWSSFFQEIGTSDEAPRYYIAITDVSAYFKQPSNRY